MSDRVRLMDAFSALGAAGVAVSFHQEGAHIVGEDNLADHKRAAQAVGTDRWVGCHVGSREHGGSYFDRAGVLRYRHDDKPVVELWWSFNHEHPGLGWLMVDLFKAADLSALWRGDVAECVIVTLGGGHR
uniref:hypothetical protein n=1 Tax=Paractinoplanes polyasparticus TaxID=2856853 RepID=UPI001C864DA7|nr:hypothetical protein [Actinoplanes polyasparticus]